MLMPVIHELLVSRRKKKNGNRQKSELDRKRSNRRLTKKRRYAVVCYGPVVEQCTEESRYECY